VLGGLTDCWLACVFLGWIVYWFGSLLDALIVCWLVCVSVSLVGGWLVRMIVGVLD